METIYSKFEETVSSDGVVIFAKNHWPMIEIEEKDYKSIASALIEAIGGRDYFCGSIDYENEVFFSTLTATLIVYHRMDEYPEGFHKTIEKVVPVWWEFSTTLPGRGEEINDFSFTDLKNYLVSTEQG